MRYLWTSVFSDLISFFFSSRRRHTRWPRDWSSDVCSSDLQEEIAEAQFAAGANHQIQIRQMARIEMAVDGLLINLQMVRSEERRVGKECRCRWWADHLKKKR